VRAWREQKGIPPPEFPPDEIRELDDTLAFPEPGSSTPRNGPPTPPPSTGGGSSLHVRRRRR